MWGPPAVDPKRGRVYFVAQRNDTEGLPPVFFIIETSPSYKVITGTHGYSGYYMISGMFWDEKNDRLLGVGYNLVNNTLWVFEVNIVTGAPTKTLFLQPIPNANWGPITFDSQKQLFYLQSSRSSFVIFYQVDLYTLDLNAMRFSYLSDMGLVSYLIYSCYYGIATSSGSGRAMWGLGHCYACANNSQYNGWGPFIVDASSGEYTQLGSDAVWDADILLSTCAHDEGSSQVISTTLVSNRVMLLVWSTSGKLLSKTFVQHDFFLRTTLLFLASIPR